MYVTCAYARAEGLNGVPGVHCLTPGGAFYTWPNVTEAYKLVGAADSEEFRKRLLAEIGVAVLSDIHFGHRNSRARGYTGFSIKANSTPCMALGCMNAHRLPLGYSTGFSVVNLTPFILNSSTMSSRSVTSSPMY